MKRGQIYWADVDAPYGRRPLVIVTRDSAVPLLSRVVVAVVTTTVRDIPSEVPVGKREGLPRRAVINCDNLLTIPKGRLDPRPAGALSPTKRRMLDDALKFSLGLDF